MAYEKQEAGVSHRSVGVLIPQARLRASSSPEYGQAVARFSQMRVRIELFGELRLTSGDRRITGFRTQKTAALLGYLAYHLDHLHARDRLAALLWPDAERDAGRLSLRVALSSLRRHLEPPGSAAGSVLIATASVVGLDPAAVTTDVREFESALATARATEGEERIHRLVSDRTR